jgi:hypothetical protein
MDDSTKAAMRNALMGALTGGAIGGGGKFLSGANKMRDIMRAAAAGGALGGTAAGATNVAGNAMMGAPDPEDPSAFKTRGLAGGALLGALAGGGMGAAGAAGKLPLRAIMAKMGIPENMITREIAKMAGNPSLSGIMKGAGLGAATVGIPLAYEGFDEGMGMDEVQEQINKEQRRKQIEKMMMYGGAM